MKKFWHFLKGDLRDASTWILIASTITILLVGIIAQSFWLATVSGVLGLLTIFFQAKGKLISQFIGIADCCSYALLAYTEKYFGETIIYLLFLLPVFIYGIFEWKKSKTENFKPRQLSRKEWLFIGLFSAIFFVGALFLLGLFDTEMLIFNSLSIVSIVVSEYLIARKNKFGFIFHLVNDLILIMLWITPIISDGNLYVLPMLVSAFVYFVNDLYGIMHWINFQNSSKNTL